MGRSFKEKSAQPDKGNAKPIRAAVRKKPDLIIAKATRDPESGTGKRHRLMRWKLGQPSQIKPHIKARLNQPIENTHNLGE
ncbi:MAG: hypothetical protein HQ514_16915 [Rhodospirillales bacterium]|nr:hypothetical protein [Rhodospirillales bacterium]